MANGIATGSSVIGGMTFDSTLNVFQQNAFSVGISYTIPADRVFVGTFKYVNGNSNVLINLSGGVFDTSFGFLSDNVTFGAGTNITAGVQSLGATSIIYLFGILLKNP